MKFFVEYNLDEKIPASVQEVFSKVKEISNISLDIGYYSDEYFTAWVHFGLESNKEERSNAISLLQSLGKEAYRFSKFTFDGLYLELYWKAKKRSRFSERTPINQTFRIMRRKKKDVIKSILKQLQEIQMEYAYDKILRVGIFTGSTRNDIVIEISRCDDTSSDCQYVIEGREFVFSLRKSCSDNEFTLFEVRSYISALKGS